MLAVLMVAPYTPVAARAQFVDVFCEGVFDLGRLSSNDPLCAEHRPDNADEERLLHDAACRVCLLVAETSCERRDQYVDRVLVVAAVCDQRAELVVGEE